jgi:hypothetical protein
MLLSGVLLASASHWWVAALGSQLNGFGTGIYTAPASFVIARLGGPGNAAMAFTTWKVAQGISIVLALQACGWLEPHWGMARVIAAGCLLSVIPYAALMSGRLSVQLDS